MGLAVLRSLRGGSRVVAFVLVAVFAQIFRNWLLLHAVGVDASFFDAIAVLIAVVTLGQHRSARARRSAPGPDPRQPGGVAAAAHGRADARDRHRRRPVLRRLGGARIGCGCSTERARLRRHGQPAPAERTSDSAFS